MVALSPDRQLHLERTVAQTVVVDVILERLRRLRDGPVDQLLHRRVGAVEERLAGGQVGLLAEAVAQLLHALLTRAATGHESEEVGPVHGRVAHVVQDQVEHRLLNLATLDDLDRGDDEPLVVDRLGVRRQRARQAATDVHHVAELRGPADELARVEDRDEHEPVVRVRDRAGALERVGAEDHVALVDALVPVGHHLVDVGAELPHDHAAAGIRDHRELVVLLPDHGAHRRAEEHGVHLIAGALERALDDVERDRVDLDPGRDVRDAEFVCGSCHESSSLGLRID